ncbi:MAG: hypothetical protein DRG78_17300 [Epsilonproteobacteria bacterium]|nr:MAG: hypothetical protein DRG78_17300 [Campylobacterota bacterium]
MAIVETPVIAKVSLLNFLYIPCIPLLTYLNIPAESIAILSILLIIDWFTGTLKVFILKGNLKSYRAIAGMITKASIVLIVLTIGFMAKGVGLDFELYLSLLVSALIISEAYSIIGNIYVCITKEDIEEFDAVASIIKKLRLIIERLLIINRDKL